MKVIGWIMAIVAGLIIIYNVTNANYDQQQIQEHPWTTLLSGGANLKGGYTFQAPYTGFEITVIAVGVIGVAIIIFARE